MFGKIPKKGIIMSKVSSADYPKYSSSSVSVGDSSASTGVVNGVLTSNYNMSDAESAIYNYALNTIASILPQINTFDPDTLSSIKSEVDAYKDSGVQQINNLYNSDLSNLENDAVSRFGNLDNSVFKDSLSDLESQRANAVSSFAQDVLSKQNELKSDELTQRYALIKFLNGLSDDIYGNALDTISTALGSSSSYNNYNSDLYNALSDMAGTGTHYNSNALISSLIGNGSTSNLGSLLTFL